MSYLLAQVQLIIFSLIPFKIFSQDTLDFSKSQNVIYAKEFKNNQQFKYFISKDSTIIHIGDTLHIGKNFSFIESYFSLFIKPNSSNSLASFNFVNATAFVILPLGFNISPLSNP